MTWKTGRKKWKNETSNCKQGTNITVRVEELSEEHKLDNGEIFILKYNQVFEGCYYKGHYNFRKLNGLVLMPILVESTLYLIHEAGTNMKRAGIYGLS